MVSARFLCSTVPFSPFVTKKYFVEQVLWNYVNNPFPIKLSPAGFSIYS